MSKNVVIAAAVIVVLGIAGWYLTRSKPVMAPEVSQPTSSTGSESATPAASTSATVTENVVTISSAGFSPKDIVIKVGESINWKNTDTQNHTVNSDPHPIHTTYAPLNLGLIKPGEEKSLTLPTAGTYKYHDHLNPSLKGSITVE